MFQNKMSMTGSLMGYENNNDVNQAKCKKPLKPLPVVSSISSGGVTTTTSKSKRARKSTRKESCIRGHVNSLWSVWYGIVAVAFQAYIAMRYARRFAGKITLPRFILLKYAFLRDHVNNIELSENLLLDQWFCLRINYLFTITYNEIELNLIISHQCIL